MGRRPDLSTAVAIVGTALTYPDALTPEALWDNVLHQRRAFRDLPDTRLPRCEYVSDDTGSPEATYVESAGLLEGWVFDRQAFRIPPDTFAAADVTHWLALDTTAKLLRALETPDGRDLPRDTTGVILGNSLTGETSRAGAMRLRWPYVERVIRQGARDSGLDITDDEVRAVRQRYLAPFPVPGDETLAGALSNTIAGRICNYYDFHGTGFTVDGACSSSLLAVAQARSALLAGELDLVIAGGVDSSLDPFELTGFARLGALSRGEMRIYDESPTGFLPGEGCGLVALMRAEDAIAQGRPVTALILGAASSSDGSGGLTRPDVHGHVRAAQRAYRQSRITGREVGLLEGHGTGTSVGDPVELQAFRTLRHGAPDRAAVGSVKANIGHTKAAAGVAGLIKAALAVHNRVLPPATGIRRPHSLLRESTELEALTEPRTWSGRRYAGVSAMGFGGINTHVVLGDADRCTNSGARSVSRIPLSARTVGRAVWVSGANDIAGVRVLVRRTLDELPMLSDSQCADRGDESTRSFDPQSAVRVALTFSGRRELREHLLTVLTLLDEAEASAPGTGDGTANPAECSGLVSRGRVHLGWGQGSRVGLLFPGQAAPQIDEDNPLMSILPRSDLVEAARAGLAKGVGARGDTAHAQPSIVGASLLGLAWLDDLGVQASCAIGHSLGELTALAWGQALAPKDAVYLASRRGALMSEHGASGTSMASLTADSVTVEDLILAAGLRPSDITISGYNSPLQVTVSGQIPALKELGALAARRGVSFTLLAVSHGFHSAAMTPVVAPFASELDMVCFSDPVGTIYSTVTGDVLLTRDDSALRRHLVTQLEAPVVFDQALERATKNVELLVECGPGRILGGLAAESDVPVVSMDVGRGSDGLAEAAAALTAAGAVADLGAWWRNRPGRRLATDFRPVLLSNPCGLDDSTAQEMDSRAQEIAWSARGPAVVEAPPLHAEGEGSARGGLGDEIPQPHPVESQVTVRMGLLRALSRATGLEVDALADGLSLSRDLHLNSLQVGQVVAQVARDHGRAMPESPLALSDATVGEAMAVLERLPENHGVVKNHAGLREWALSFVDTWVPLEQASITAADTTPGAVAFDRVLDLRTEPDPEGAIVELVGAILGGHVSSVVVVHGGDFAALARSLAVEGPADLRVCSVESDLPLAKVIARLPADRRFHDLRMTAPSVEEREVARWTGVTGAVPVGCGDVVVVTGGLTGITAECAAALSEETGARYLFVGRRGAEDPTVQEGLSRWDGDTAHYVSADVVSNEGVAHILRVARSLGPVRGLIHGAGVNHPRPLRDVTKSSLLEAHGPKASAFELLVSAMAPEELELVVTFGSIIGRCGLQGELDYAVANERLRAATERLASHRPHAVVRHLEWSVWSGVGMGVDLGVLDTLARVGVGGIGVHEGRREFMQAVSTAGPTTRLITGRFPPTVTLRHRQPADHRPWRFAESILTCTPDVEAVVESTVSVDTDVALREHVIDEVAVLPAVQALEAAAQAATVMSPHGAWRRFEDVRLLRPVTTGAAGEVVVRTSVLSGAADPPAGADERALVHVHSDTDGFQQPCMTAWLRDAPASTLDHPGSKDPLDAGASILHHPAVPLWHGETDTHLYGPLFFHGRAFRRVRRLAVVGADILVAALSTHEARWYSAFLPQRLALGDPALLDATIHALQACHPTRRLLPVAAAAFEVADGGAAGSGSLTLVAREADQALGHDDGDDGDLVFDVDLLSEGARAVSWRGLRLRAVGPLGAASTDPRLIGAALARDARALHLDSGVDVLATQATVPVDEIMAVLGRAGVGHGPSGRLVGEGVEVSTSVSGGLRLTAVRPGGSVGVDLVLGGDDLAPALGSPDQALLRHLPDGWDAFAVWALREAATKAGVPSTADFRVRSCDQDVLVVVTGSGAVIVRQQRFTGEPFDGTRLLGALYLGGEGHGR